MSNKEIKDCTTCDWGHENDMFNIPFCYNVEPCVNWDKWTPKMQQLKEEKPYNYSELRDKIHNILSQLLEREIDCAKGEEFDNEFFEAITDNILSLIKQQGGSY